MTRQDPDRDATLREQLVLMVDNDVFERRIHRRWRKKVLVGSLAAVLLGSGVAAAAASIGGYWPSDTAPAIPGAPSSTVLSDGVTYEGSGKETLKLGTAPAGATDLSVSFKCLSNGPFRWGLEESQMYSLICDRITLSNADLRLSSEHGKLFVEAKAGAAWSVSVRFVHKETTEWGTNARGETFGAVVPGGEMPDLVAVVGRDAAQQSIEGYVKAADLRAAEMTSGGVPKPYLDVFASDGVTRIGVFEVGEMAAK